MNNNQEEYFKNVVNTYSQYQSNLLESMTKINQFQRNLKFKEFYDITIRVINAHSSSIRYFKKNNMNYYDNNIYNSDRVLMQAIESYLFHKFKEACNEFSDYVSSVNNISDTISRSLKFKLFTKIHNPKIYNYDIRKNFECLQYRVDNFYDIGNNISDFEVEKNINEALLNYIPKLYIRIKNTNVLDDEFENFELKSQLFHLKVLDIITSLKKIGVLDQVMTIANLEKELLLNDLEELKSKQLVKK